MGPLPPPFLVYGFLILAVFFAKLRRWALRHVSFWLFVIPGCPSLASVFGVLVLGSSELGVSFVLCFIFRAVGFRVLCWVLGSS